MGRLLAGYDSLKGSIIGMRSHTVNLQCVLTMKTSFSTSFAVLLIGSFPLSIPAWAAFQYEADKIPVLVMQSEVTVDGEERPALGRSFTDTLTGGLLKSGGFSVIDYLSIGPIAVEIAKTEPGRAPELSASQFGQMTGAHLVYVPRMVVEDDFLRMTIKKIRVTDGAVLTVYETEARGGREAMFTLAEDLLDQINAELQHERAEKSAAERRLRKASETPVEEIAPEEVPLPQPPSDLPFETESGEVVEVALPEAAENPTGAKPAPLAMAAKKPGKKVAPTQDIGNVTTVNRDYAFCILSVFQGAEVAVGDELRVLIDDPLIPMVKLRVSKIDGRQAVAERVSGGTMDRVTPGQRAIRITAADH
jgi:hypothetical protein